MKDIISDNDMFKIEKIKETIKEKDIRTHSQLKAESAKNGFDVQLKKDDNGNLKSYSITDNVEPKLQMDSTKEKDKKFMKQFNDLIKGNRDKAIQKAREPNKNNLGESKALTALAGVKGVIDNVAELQKGMGGEEEEGEGEEQGESNKNNKKKGEYSR